MRDRAVSVVLPFSKLVPTTTIHQPGGYDSITCIMCDQTGWRGQSDYGFHHGTENKVGMVHTKGCVLNQFIDPVTGRLR